MPCTLSCAFRAKQAGAAVVVSLQDAVDLAAQGIDADAVAAACTQAGVKHVRCPTSDTGGRGGPWGPTPGMQQLGSSTGCCAGCTEGGVLPLCPPAA